jgi:hypothetical protein
MLISALKNMTGTFQSRLNDLNVQIVVGTLSSDCFWALEGFVVVCFLIYWWDDNVYSMCIFDMLINIINYILRIQNLYGQFIRIGVALGA